MRKHVMIPALLALSVGLAACSHDPNANLESARTNFSSLQSDPQASKVAALETKDAQDWLNKADKAYMDREDEKKVDQLAYLTNQRVEVAKQTIALRTAEAELKNASAQRAQAKLDARDAQIAKLQDSLRTGDAADFAARVQAYAQQQWRHMAHEEKVVLPAASQHLQPDDWRAIAHAFEANADPLQGDSGSFDRLAARLLDLARRG